MLFKGKKGLELARIKVRYTKNGEEFEKEIGAEGKKWWVDFANKWDDIEIIEFVDIVYTAEQLSRFEEVKDVKAGEDILSYYVINGVFPEGINHPLRNLQVEKDIANAYFEIMMGGMQ